MLYPSTENASICVDIVQAVSEAEGRHHTALPPLNDAINVDALNALFNPNEDTTRETPQSISFQYSESTVSIGSTGTLSIQKASPAD